jgi:hypothetical protein
MLKFLAAIDPSMYLFCRMGHQDIRDKVEKIRLWFVKHETPQPEIRRAYDKLLELLKEGAARNMVIDNRRCSDHYEVFSRFVYRIDKIENPAITVPYENDETPEELYDRQRNLIRIQLLVRK